MRVALISDWFAERMGYAENCLPKALAAAGCDVHLITSDVQPYYNSPDYRQIYEPFIGPAVQPTGTKRLDGYTLHRLPHATAAGRLRIRGLAGQLRALRPHVVQTFEATSLSTVEAAIARSYLRYALFLESHIHASVFPPALGPVRPRHAAYWKLHAALFGRLVSAAAERCYPVSDDAADIAIRFLGIDAGKIEICSLGVDTDLFAPAVEAIDRVRRSALREELGFAPTDIVCIYTGRFSEDKNPLCLARAIARLADRGRPYRGLFVGNGTAEQVAALRACAGCVVHPFVPVQELAAYYRAADLGVWPKQESTSQLDAAACGLPLVISDRVTAVERIEGNGLSYVEDDPVDLARTLERLAAPEFRQRLSLCGVEKVQQQFSWRGIARRRIAAYEAALRGDRRTHPGQRNLA